MTAWEILTGNSTLSSGTAWQHLNNQEAGGGDVIIENIVLQVFDELDVEYEMNYDVEIDNDDLVVEVEDIGLEVVFDEDVG